VTRIERAILGYLDAAPPGRIPLSDVALAVFGTSEPTQSQRASLRHAARKLTATERIDLTTRGFDSAHQRQYYVTAKRRAQGRPQRSLSVNGCLADSGPSGLPLSKP
jgi:hypothetical protein